MGSVSEEKKETISKEAEVEKKEVEERKEPDELKKVVAESMARKNEIATLKAKLDEIEAEKVKQEEAKLLKAGEYEKLIKAKEEEISKLRPDAEAYSAYKTSVIEDTKKVLGEDWEDAFGSLPLSAIQKLAKVQVKKEKIDTDTGIKGAKEDFKIELTEGDKAEAIRRYPSSTLEKAYELYKDNLIKIKQRQIQKEKQNGK